MVDFDCIIVGAGAAGSVLAKRLSEDPNNNVRLEYGGRDWSPLIYVPKGFYNTLRFQVPMTHCATLGPNSDDVVDPNYGSAASPDSASSMRPSCRFKPPATVRHRRWRSPGSPPASSSKTEG
jgi:choline dehydrogenase-like flavoprotein